MITLMGMKGRRMRLSTEDIKSLYEFSGTESSLVIEGECIDCGHPVHIQIFLLDKIKQKYLITGGAICQKVGETFVMKCVECYEKDPIVRNIETIRKRNDIKLGRCLI